MRRALFNFAPAVSLVACLAVMGLCVRSYRTADWYGHSWPVSGTDRMIRQYAFDSARGCVSIVFITTWCHDAGWQDDEHDDPHWEHTSPPWSSAGVAGYGMEEPPPGILWNLGFSGVWRTSVSDHPNPLEMYEHPADRARWIGIGLPYWFVALCLSALPVFTVYRWLRFPKMGCHHCGYNLTANTSGLCSECGTPVAQRSEQANLVRRRLLVMASAFWLSMCVVTAASWVRSHTSPSLWLFEWHGTAYAFFSERGSLGIDNRPQIQRFLADRDERMNTLGAKLNRSFGATLRHPLLSPLLSDSSGGATPPAEVRYTVPYWMLSLGCLAIPPVFWLARSHRRKRRLAGKDAQPGTPVMGSQGK